MNFNKYITKEKLAKENFGMNFLNFILIAVKLSVLFELMTIIYYQNSFMVVGKNSYISHLFWYSIVILAVILFLVILAEIFFSIYSLKGIYIRIASSLIILFFQKIVTELFMWLITNNEMPLKITSSINAIRLWSIDEKMYCFKQTILYKFQQVSSTRVHFLNKAFEEQMNSFVEFVQTKKNLVEVREYAGKVYSQLYDSYIMGYNDIGEIDYLYHISMVLSQPIMIIFAGGIFVEKIIRHFGPYVRGFFF